MSDPHRVRVKLICRSRHEHELCLMTRRGVPPELRCESAAPSGFGGGGDGCPIPPDIDRRVESELGRNLQESKRRGFVLIEG